MTATPIVHLLAFTVSGPAPSAQDFLPCKPGLAITYRWHPVDQRALGDTRIDRVQRQEGRLCFIRRTTRLPAGTEQRDVFVVERLADRVLDAGWKGAMTAFRAPLLLGPIRDGRRWHFNRVDYRLTVLKGPISTPAGAFSQVVRVASDSVPRGRFRSVRFYARDVGLVEDRREDGAWVAVRVEGAGRFAPHRTVPRGR